MISGLLKPFMNPWAKPAASVAAPQDTKAVAASQQAQAQQQSSSQQPSAPQETSQTSVLPASGSGLPAAPVAPSEAGVRFDLSDQALSPASGSGLPAAPVALTEAGVRFDLSDQALQMVELAASSLAARPEGSQMSAPRAADPEPAPFAAGERSLEARDPTEEERARAWAIRGMEREKLLDLLDTLRVTPNADPAQKEVAERTALQPSIVVARREAAAAA